MESIFLFAISYVIFFIIYLIFYYFRGLKKETILDSLQVEFLKVRFGFKNKELKPKKIGLIVTLVDPLIISLTGTIVSLPKWNYIISLLVGFVILMALIFSLYEILGRILKRKVDKNEYKRNRK